MEGGRVMKVGDLVKAPYLLDHNPNDAGIVLKIINARVVRVMWPKKVGNVIVHLLEILNESR
jgi:hypothetical protein